MTRHMLREHCFKLLFCMDFYADDEKQEQILRYFEQPDEEDTTEEGKTEKIHSVELSDEDKKEVITRMEDILSHLKEIDLQLENASEGWTLRRMGKEELALLRLAAYEIIYDDNVPEKVAINEAVELSKEYGGDDSPAFVNGILAKLV